LHETVLSWSNAAFDGLGVCCRCHEVPFQVAASVTSPTDPEPKPTASQNWAEIHDTWFSPTELSPTGTGNRCIFQPRPLHTSASVNEIPSRYEPTAMQKSAAGQDTPSRFGSTDPAVSTAGSGVCCRCQVVPFHRSARVTVIPAGLRSCPTAVHALADEQETDP